MTGGLPGALTAIVAHARCVPAVDRSALAAELRTALPHGALLVETCHRVEAYVAGDTPTVVLPDGAERLDGDAAARHAISVTVGADSIVVLEDQILHQVRGAVAHARAAGRLDPTVDRLFAMALRAGRRARSWRSGEGRSLADAALEAIRLRRDDVRANPVLVVGAGRMGAAAARTLAAAGADVAVTSLRAESAREVGRSLGLATEAFDPGAGLARYHSIVVALAGPWTIGTSSIAAIEASGAVLVDLSVPLAVPDVLARSLGDRFVTADDLARTDVPIPGDDPRTSARIARLIDDTTAEFLEWQELRAARTTADALQRRADRKLETELSALWRRVPGLDPGARAAIEDMSRRLTDHLLREPLERLGRDRDGELQRAARDLFQL